MRRFITQNLLLLVVVTATARADDLFSEVSIDSVFGSSTSGLTESSKSTERVGAGKRISGASALRKTLEAAGLSIREFDSKSVLTTLKAPRTKGGELTAYLSVDVDSERLIIAMALAQVDEKKISSQKLLEMMNAGRNGDAIYFAYSPDQNWLGIRRTVSNEGVTANSLRVRLDEMVNFAQNTIDTWQSQGTTNTSPKDGETNVTQNRAQPEKISLVGLWGATGSKGEGYGLQFEKDRFELAISVDGKVSSSKGSFTLKENQLTLVGDGIKLSGTMTIKSSREFELKLDGLAALTFKKD